MRDSCLPCCCLCFYLGLLITHNQPGGQLCAEVLAPMVGTARGTAGTERQTPSPPSLPPFGREGAAQHHRPALNAAELGELCIGSAPNSGGQNPAPRHTGMHRDAASRPTSSRRDVGISVPTRAGTPAVPGERPCPVRQTGIPSPLCTHSACLQGPGTWKGCSPTQKMQLLPWWCPQAELVTGFPFALAAPLQALHYLPITGQTPTSSTYCSHLKL